MSSADQELVRLRGAFDRRTSHGKAMASLVDSARDAVAAEAVKMARRIEQERDSWQAERASLTSRAVNAEALVESERASRAEVEERHAASLVVSPDASRAEVSWGSREYDPSRGRWEQRGPTLDQIDEAMLRLRSAGATGSTRALSIGEAGITAPVTGQVPESREDQATSTRRRVAWGAVAVVAAPPAGFAAVGALAKAYSVAWGLAPW